MAFSQSCWLLAEFLSLPHESKSQENCPGCLRWRPDAVDPPLLSFLAQAFDDFRSDISGAAANYIPELSKADPAIFGVAIATIDGHVYEVGDSTSPFTIQSVSKAFVFALALEMLGADQVEEFVGVEPSGEAFNSIRLNAKNQPFNPMVNAGAIACSGLIYKVKGAGAFEAIHDMLCRFAGRKLAVDETVHASESATGDRNRAIGWMLRNYGIVKDDVNAVLDVYFRQCAVLVTARDLAVMAGTLANNGVNPVTGEQVVSPFAVARTLSVMTSSGMYDYAGEWVYRVGMPAKSGVGGGIIAALPSQIGLGTFSPLLDEHGNSRAGPAAVRGSVSPFRVACAQPRERRAHLHRRRLRCRPSEAARPAIARAAPARRQRDRDPHPRTHRHADLRQYRLRRPPHPLA